MDIWKRIYASAAIIAIVRVLLEIVNAPELITLIWPFLVIGGAYLAINKTDVEKKDIRSNIKYIFTYGTILAFIHGFFSFMAVSGLAVFGPLIVAIVMWILLVFIGHILLGAMAFYIRFCFRYPKNNKEAIIFVLFWGLFLGHIGDNLGTFYPMSVLIAPFFVIFPGSLSFLTITTLVISIPVISVISLYLVGYFYHGMYILCGGKGKANETIVAIAPAYFISVVFTLINYFIFSYVELEAIAIVGAIIFSNCLCIIISAGAIHYGLKKVHKIGNWAKVVTGVSVLISMIISFMLGILFLVLLGISSATFGGL